MEVREPLGEVTRYLRPRPNRHGRRRHRERHLRAVGDLARDRERRLDSILAFGGERKAEGRRAHRGLERRRHLDLDRARVRLLLHGVAHALEASRPGGLLARDRPADHASTSEAGVVVDDHQPGGERNARVLDDPERSRGLERERLDDHACGFERVRQRLERELGPSRPVDNSEPGAGMGIHEVVRKRAPARFKLPRP